MTKPKKAYTYYNFDKLFSFNATYNFVAGGRGIGKTFGAKKRAIANAIKKNEMFIYLRRYKTELSAAKDTFFADINDQFKTHDFRIHGYIAQSSPIADRETKKRVWKTIGYFFALSTAQSLKSVSFPDVTLIVYDEFILEKGAFHYIPNESVVFNNFYSTVDRGQDKTKVLFLANSVSIMNPYFIEYDIAPDNNKEFITKFSGFVCCHFPNSDMFANEMYETAFGKFIKHTDYAKYAVGNEFADNHENLLGGKTSKARYHFTIECHGGSFSVWHDIMSSEYYIQEKLPKNQMILTLVAEKMSADKMLVNFSDPPLAYLRSAFRQGKVTFDKPATRNTFADIFKR